MIPSTVTLMHVELIALCYFVIGSAKESFYWGRESELPNGAFGLLFKEMGNVTLEAIFSVLCVVFGFLPVHLHHCFREVPH